MPVVTKRGVRRPLSLEDSQKSLFLTQGISCRDGGAQIAWLDNLWLKLTSARLLQVIVFCFEEQRISIMLCLFYIKGIVGRSLMQLLQGGVSEVE